jgi:multiple sugar transport system permease protein
MEMLDAVQGARKTKARGWRRLTRAERREARWGYAFIGLWIVGFLTFYFLPMAASLVFSFFDFELTRPDEATFIGLDNWRKLLFEDPRVWQALRVTFTFALISLPIGSSTAST